MDFSQFKRRLVAEFLGTAILLATVVGSGNTLPTGAILMVLIAVFGETSGAHFNPAVTAALFMRREIAASVALTYVAVQILGALTGMLAAHLMFDVSLFQVSKNFRTGPARFSERGGDVRPAPHHFRHAAQPAGGDPFHGRRVYNGRLLVHGVDELRQSGGDDCARLHQLFFRHCARPCACLYHGAAGRGSGCYPSGGMALRAGRRFKRAPEDPVNRCRRVSHDRHDLSLFRAD